MLNTLSSVAGKIKSVAEESYDQAKVVNSPTSTLSHVVIIPLWARLVCAFTRMSACSILSSVEFVLMSSQLYLSQAVDGKRGSEIEKKVKEATSLENWNASSTLKVRTDFFSVSNLPHIVHMYTHTCM